MLNTKSVARWSVLSGLVLGLGLASTARADAPEHYTLTVSPAALTSGHKGEVDLAIAPESGWHWNSEYPAHLELAAPGDVTIAKVLDPDTGAHFKVGADGKVAAAFAVTAAHAGKTDAKLSGKFGICDDRSCLIKHVELTVSLVAGP